MQKKAKRKLNEQTKAANTRAKYGPRGKPAPVVVKRLDGTVVEMVDQTKVAGLPESVRKRIVRDKAIKRSKRAAR